MNKYITGITYGSFDFFHKGHYNLLKSASNLCDKLIVAVSTDEFNKVKGKECHETTLERMRVIGDLKFVDEVIVESCWSQKEHDIKYYNADVVIMGDDWKDRDEFKNLPCKTVFFPRTKGISSTQLRKIINK